MHLENVERALALAMGAPGVDSVKEVLQRTFAALLPLFRRGSHGQRRGPVPIAGRPGRGAATGLQRQTLGLVQSLLGASTGSRSRGLLSALLPIPGLTGRRSDDRAGAFYPPPRPPLAEMLRLHIARTEGAIVPIDFDLAGRPRFSERANAVIPPASITVQVNALDSKSFIERSEDIATALKEALLHSHSIADVLMER